VCRRRISACLLSSGADASFFMNLDTHVTSTMQSEAAEKLEASLFGEV
jgi:hypothetical protein